MTDAPSPAPASAATPSAPLSGRAAEEHKHGYRPMPETATTPKAPPREINAREAADAVAKRRQREARNLPEARPIAYRDEHGRTAPENETVSLERAADDLKQSRQNEAALKQIHINDALASEVDGLRTRAGVPTDEPSQPQIEPEIRQAIESEFANVQQNVPGLDAELDRAMKHPQVRQAIEQEIGKATQLQQQHTQQINLANQFAQAAFREAFPEMQNLELHQVVPFLQQMARTNPQRAQMAQNMLNRVAQGIQAQHQLEQHRAHQERQNFERFAREHDAAFERAVGPRTPAQRQAMATELVSYAAELGINRATMVNLLKSNPIMRHAAFQKMVYDAVQARISNREAATYRQKLDRSLPPVQRPGTSAAGGVRQVQSQNLQTLSNRLTRTGDAKDAAALLMAMRAARR